MPSAAAAFWRRSTSRVISVTRSPFVSAKSAAVTAFASICAPSWRFPMALHREGHRSNLYYYSTQVRGGGGAEKPSFANDESQAPYRVYVAVGSNLGNRFDNIRRALHLLCQSSSSCRLIQTSFLHETTPMYVTDQPPFLNGAVELATSLTPHELLDELKRIERQLGRKYQGDGAGSVIRNGPRPIDLDILFYETRVEEGGSWFRRETLHSENPDLTIPHPRIQERTFVLQPLQEVAGPSFVHPVLNATISELYERLRKSLKEEQANGDGNAQDAVRVLPLPRNRFLYWNETLVMGILNVTPDSFSDGGQYKDVEAAAERALQMVHQGASMIDIGGESTRPRAEEVSVEEELNRTIPVIRRIRELSLDVPISIDTRRAAVAKAAVEAGADLVNDVSGGSFDPAMLETVAALGVPMVLMHMRGTPQTMQTMTDYGDGENSVVDVVAAALANTSKSATAAGIHRWLQIVDPGIGFAKDMKGNLLLLRNLSKIRAATGNLPLLLGTSRKGFLGKLAGVDVAADRDFATVASCVAPLCLERDSTLAGTMLRVHNPGAMVQAVKVMEAIVG